MRNVLLSLIPTAMFPGILPRALRTLPTLLRYQPICRFPSSLKPANSPHYRVLVPPTPPRLSRTMASSTNSQVFHCFQNHYNLEAKPISTVHSARRPARGSARCSYSVQLAWGEGTALQSLPLPRLMVRSLCKYDSG